MQTDTVQHRMMPYYISVSELESMQLSMLIFTTSVSEVLSYMMILQYA